VCSSDPSDLGKRDFIDKALAFFDEIKQKLKRTFKHMRFYLVLKRHDALIILCFSALFKAGGNTDFLLFFVDMLG
jgi:hypothetical protein